MSILDNKERNGNFTSSKIAALLSEPPAAAKKAGEIFGKAAVTYIKERNYERRLGRSLDTELKAKAVTWGLLVEYLVFQKLGLDYILTSDVTKQHPTIPYWLGSKDAWKDDEGMTVIDIKSPLTPKSFCDLVTPLYDGLTGMNAINAVRDMHTEGDTYYTQLLSNACIDSAEHCELIVFMPYKKFLPDIRMRAKKLVDDGQDKFKWIMYAEDGELPWLPDDGYYKDLNIIRFTPPQEDRDNLTSRVRKAGELLINVPKRLGNDQTHPYVQSELKKPVDKRKGDLLI